MMFDAKQLKKLFTAKKRCFNVIYNFIIVIPEKK